MLYYWQKNKIPELASVPTNEALGIYHRQESEVRGSKRYVGVSVVWVVFFVVSYYFAYEAIRKLQIPLGYKMLATTAVNLFGFSVLPFYLQWRVRRSIQEKDVASLTSAKSADTP
jgi:hypothetical protein